MTTTTRTGLLGDIHTEKKRMDRERLTAVLKAAFVGKTLDEVARVFTSDVQMALEYFDLQAGKPNVCQDVSLLFNPHRLTIRTLAVSKTGGRSTQLSVYESLSKNEKYIGGLARFTLAMRGKKKGSAPLFNAIRNGVEGVRYVEEFPPHIARDIYKQFHCGADSRILDPCAGWGGRMIGASVVSNRYLGFEPSTQTHAGLKQLSKRLTSYSPEFKGVVKCLPFEDAELPDDYFDIALTSPPYYDTEQYTDEETNSLNRYSTFREWCEGFYFPLIQKTMDALKPGGVFVLNIGSRKYPLNERLLWYCEDAYKVTRLNGQLLSGKGGLNKKGEGETFYVVHK